MSIKILVFIFLETLFCGIIGTILSVHLPLCQSFFVVIFWMEHIFTSDKKQLFIWHLVKLYTCHYLNFWKVWSHGKKINQLAQVSQMELIGGVVTWSDLTIDLWCNWASAWKSICKVMIFTTKWIENRTLSDFRLTFRFCFGLSSGIVTWCDFSWKQIDWVKQMDSRLRVFWQSHERFDHAN